MRIKFNPPEIHYNIVSEGGMQHWSVISWHWQLCFPWYYKKTWCDGWISALHLGIGCICFTEDGGYI